MEADVRARGLGARSVVMASAFVLAWAWSALALAQGTLGGPLPRVYVFTQLVKPGEAAPPDQAARRASVADIRAELEKKPGLLRLADIPLDADVLVEVLARESLSGQRCLLTVRVRRTVESIGRRFQGEGPDWKEAALLVADAVRRYVNEM